MTCLYVKLSQDQDKCNINAILVGTNTSMHNPMMLDNGLDQNQWNNLIDKFINST